MISSVFRSKTSPLSHKNCLCTIDNQYDAVVRLSDAHVTDNSSIRPGDVAILWNKCISYAVSEIDVNFDTDRFVGIKLSHKGMQSMFIFCVYMPSTNTSIEYKHVLDILQTVYDTYFERGIVVFTGDFNAQLGHDKPCRRDISIKQNIRGFCGGGCVFLQLPLRSGETSQITNTRCSKNHNVKWLNTYRVSPGEYTMK